MDFSIEALHRMDDDLAAVLKSIGNLDQIALKGKNKPQGYFSRLCAESSGCCEQESVTVEIGGGENR